jgi:hypothetical protein
MALIDMLLAELMGGVVIGNSNVVRVYRHYAVGVIDCSNIVLIVFVVKLRSLSNCELATLTLMVLCTLSPSEQFAAWRGLVTLVLDRNNSLSVVSLVDARDRHFRGDCDCHL